MLTALLLSAQTIFIEAEAFDELGGWKVDTQTTLTVGSAYLLAHGLGQPVADARTTVEVADPGEYRVLARTRDWVAPWSPGRFAVLIDGKAVGTELGTAGAEWGWQEAGRIVLEAGTHTLALHDLTGFDGRCDAVCLTRASGDPVRPTYPPETVGEYDLVVVGGGYSGLAAALSAARQSLRVALIQDRRVLGGNGSSEVRVWANGGTMRGRFPHLGEIVEEFADHAPDSPGPAETYGDALKEAVARREPTLDLYLGHFAHAVDTADDGTITAVQATEVRTGRERRFTGRLFADCTGHGTIGALAGAAFEMKPDGRMGMSNMWYWQERDDAPAWPETPWALALEPGDFPGQPRGRSRIEGLPFYKGEWFWESGFDKDAIQDHEAIRDWNLRAVYGAFAAIRRENPRAALAWVAYVGGTRESRLLRGDVVLTADHIREGHAFPDGTVATTWDIDLHYPKEAFAAKFPDNPFISRAEFGAGVDRDAGYPVPYRCFYSKDVNNLFMAGRCISVTHEALGTVRVMRTCGMMGEVVGRAAYLCVRHDTTPRGVYAEHLTELLALQENPGAMRRDSLTGELYRDASVGPVRSYRTKGEDVVDGLAPPAEGVDVSALPGLVIDDENAELTGSWRPGTLTPFVGRGYRYANPGTDAEARFAFDVREPGRYELRLAWVGHENRGERVRLTLERAGQRPLALRIDQSATADELFHTLGAFDLPVGAASVVLSAADADGHVHADAVQLVRVP